MKSQETKKWAVGIRPPGWVWAGDRPILCMASRSNYSTYHISVDIYPRWKRNAKAELNQVRLLSRRVMRCLNYERNTMAWFSSQMRLRNS